MRNIQKDLLDAFESSGLTYDDLARRTNLPKSALYRYLNGDTEKIPIDRFQSICDELHLDARSVLGWTVEEDPPDLPQTPEARILSRGVDQLPEEDRLQLLEMARVMFKHVFDKEDDHGPEL